MLTEKEIRMHSWDVLPQVPSPGWERARVRGMK